MKRKIVMHIIHSLSYGGVESSVINIVNKFSEEKQYVQIICLVGRVIGSRVNEIPKNVKIIHCPMFIEPINHNNKIKILISFIRTLKGIVANNKVNIVHTHLNLINAIIAIAVRTSKVKDIKIVSSSYTTHNIYEKFSILLKSTSSMLIKLLSNVCVSDSRESLRYVYNKTKEDKKYKVISAAMRLSEINLQVSHSKGVNYGDCLTIGHVGRFSEPKNHKFIIDIVSVLVSDGVNVKCILVGDGPLKNEVQRYITNRKLDQYIEILDNVIDITKVLCKFNIFLFPSKFESLPVALLEAQAAGVKCVISKDITVDADIFQDIVTRVSLNNSPEFWAGSILAISDISYNRNELTRRVQESKFNIDNVTINIKKCYE